MVDKMYENADSINGETSWCDFLGQDEWGEITLIHQDDLSVEWLRRTLFKLDLEEIERKYKIEIERKTEPAPLKDACISPTFQVCTQSAIEAGLQKKLEKTYPHKDNGFSNKGTLILGIADPTFENFKDNLEIRFGALNLKSLEEMAKTLAPSSCFIKVLLVDSLVPFHKNPEKSTYTLL